MKLRFLLRVFTFAAGSAVAGFAADGSTRPNIVLVMADDMGWGETSYTGHPGLKTPQLDAMAASGLRFDRFYAGAPVCSPTRATVLTGRSNDRTGVNDHGFALRRQEKTVAQALRAAGYATAHFGKWHLNGYRGPGAPVVALDPYAPGPFGFDEWLSVTNYFDRNPILGSRKGFVEFSGDSSEIIVAEALRFITRSHSSGKPSFTVIWYGSPHHPARAAESDMTGFASLDRGAANHYGELVALDRSIGQLRRGLRDLAIAENTLVWFCSDNGGLKDITPETVGGLRNFKGSLYEGGLRVPAIIEWPAVIRAPRITRHPAVTLDIFPTLAEIVGLPTTAMLRPSDGISLKSLFTQEQPRRPQPIPFRYLGGVAMIDNRYKVVSQLIAKGKFGEFELYDLEADPWETNNLASAQPEVRRRLVDALHQWQQSVERSAGGGDYAEGRVDPSHREKPRSWTTAPEYAAEVKALLQRPEFRRTAEQLEQR